ncbi:hypothetical protein [Janthinobacterium sp. NKUCC08_JDC]|uniref:hypothetical protein n=1 Tax=Janthinobacterium sp. NKUCC08_JDC TaxID=2842122 RepID=UPI001C5A9903|nr:hypothetical protein [Janthinobacterium sp. NKUCC08_JDC]MBW3496984.1 hypothetical protein [Janthinobacterium sp. NKUCC08_JDC]
MIISTRYLPARFDAMTVWPLILVRPASRGDDALLLHEMVHYREQRNCGVLPWLLRYAMSARFRLGAEVRGYRAQMAAGGISLERAAALLMRYGVDITHAQAIALLKASED